MSESIFITGTTKEEKYTQLLPQIAALIGDEKNTVANMANVSAALHEVFPFLWTGFYVVDPVDNQLVLGPFQGPIACTRIAKNKGVCGTAWHEAETQIVPNVNLFPGHIACSSLSVSEIVIPLKQNNHVWGVLDVDSTVENYFDQTDRIYLEKICQLIQP